MSTFTIRVTSSATNTAGTNWGQQPDLLAPSFLDMIVSGSTDPIITNGVYDAYCLNPLIDITLAPTSYLATGTAGNTTASYTSVGFGSITQAQVDQVNWLLAQNFTSDPKYLGQFNYGEVQTAIWKIIGFTDAQIGSAGLDRFLNDNNRNVVDPADINFLISSAQSAVASGNGVVPTDAFFASVIDPNGNVQPLIIQLQSAKLGDYVWADTNANGIQDSGEAGINNVIVELYDNNGVFIASTVTGDDFSTAAVEQGYYQFTGLKAGDYQVKFIAPAGQFIAPQDANGNTQDAADSDANIVTGFSQVVHLNAGESNQTIDAGLYQKASLGDYVWVDSNNDGQQNDGATGMNGVTVNLYDGNGVFISSTVTADNAGQPGYYLFDDLTPGDYKVEFIKPTGYAFAKQDQGADGSDSDADTTTGMTIVTTLTSGENDLSWDAGLVKLGSLGDRVWEDTNANGVQDNGEQGIANVTVKLYDCNTNVLLDTTTTDVNGIYHFTDLMPGVYHVEFVAPNGYVYSAQDVTAENLGTDSDANSAGITACYTLNSGDDIDTVDAGLYQKASLGDYVWVDSNNDGQQNDGATGMNGVTVNLYDGNGVFISSTVTADNAGQPGYYLFDDLTPGDYKVEFIKPTGYAFAKQDQGADGSDSDADTTTGMTIVTTLTSGENDLSWDAGLVKLGSLGDRVWEDTNANGVQDNGEQGIANVTVKLYDCNTNALLDTTTTDINGIYHFTDLMPGVYHVEFVAPNGYVYTQQDVTAENLGTDSDANSAGITACYTLNSGDDIDTVDAGLYQKASLGDYVWVDSNNDGQQNDGATGMNGVTVNLYDGNGVFISSTVTADNAGQPGYYLFDDLTPGDYKVEFIKPTGYAFAKQDQGADGSDSDADTTSGMTIVTTLSSGENDLSWDAGLVKLGSLGDRVWEDTNANGVQDNGEQGIANVTVKLYDCATNALLDTTTTDVNGIYHFTDLMPGVYHVEFVAPNGYVYSAQDVTAENLGTDSDANSAGITACYTLNSGDDIDTVDAGLYQKASLGDYVWVDSNNDGQQNDGATGMNGVTVNLYDGNGVFISSTVTADNAGQPGYYLFDDLTPGDYKVEFIKPTGYAFAKQDQGADGSDSDADTTSGMTIVTTLSSGENDLSWDAGLVKLGSLGDRVWEDTNANGVQDNGEQGIANVTVKLYDCATNALLDTTTTDVNGIYHFTDLMPGVYHVEFVAPNGYVYSAQDVTAENLGTDSDANSAGITACYTLNSGDDIDTVDAGLYQKASLGDYVWVDSNNDGQQNDGATGMNGVTVNLYDGNGVFISSTVTADNAGQPGYYLFDDLTPGDYKVEFIKPTGYAFAKQDQGADGSDSDADTTSGMTIVTTLSSGENDLSWDAGLVKLGSLGDRVWEDTNANGVQDNGEQGIANVTVKLYDCATNALLDTTTTDVNGIYHFTDLMPGVYHVEFVAPNGYVYSAQDVTAEILGTDSDANSAGITACYTLNSGDDIDTVDAGLYQKASLGDYVWVDSNNDGQQNDGATGMNGVTVNLYDGNGVFISSTVTADNAGQPGYYLFDDLTPGDYKVEFIKPTGYAFAKQDQGADGSDSDADTTSGMTIVTTLSSGENDLSWDAGLVKLGSLGDRVWEDTNANGVQDNGEQGIANVTVKLYDCATNALLDTTTTDVNGIYHFTDLMPGVYHVEFVAPNGYVYSAQDVTAEILGTDSDANSAGITACYTLNSGDDIDTVDAGLYQKASLGDYVWVDSNNDGQQNDGATGMNGVTVNLYDGNGVFISSTVTADNAGQPGYYLFDDLTPGDYKVEFIKPTGYAFAKQDQGADGSDSDADTTSGMTIVTTLSSGENDLSWDAGLVKLGSLGDRVWEDTNANGVQDNGEQGIANVTVKLYDCATNALLDTTTTDVNGIYHFTDLMPGVYHVEFVAPNGYVYSAQDVTAEILGTDSDANSAGITACYTLNSGDDIDTVDAGLYQKASLGDYVWVDSNNDGQQNDGATGMNGVTVNLYDGNGVFISSTVTADNAGQPGYYLFDDLTPGDYKVEFIKPTGYAFAKQDQGADGSDSDADTTSGMTIVTTLSSGENDLSWDAGLVKLGSLGDRVWEDTNANGVQDNGEQGIANVTVKLYDCATNALLDTTTTDVNGIYHFTDLMPGVYHVEFVAPNGYVYSAQDVTAEILGTDSDANSAGITACYTLNSGDNIDTVDAGLVALTPGIDIEKTTNGPTNSNTTAPDYDNEDAANGAGVPILAAGSAVTWTYQVTNTGNVAFARSDIAIVDDNGTVGNTADDMSIANGKITYLSGDIGNDNILSAGEVWLYQATGTVQALTTLEAATTFDFSGSSALDGTDGNIRTFTAGGISVHASAFSRVDGTNGAWSQAWLGSYGGGLGVTDSSEGSGGSNTHTVDNMGGRGNYVLFEFDQDVVLDSAYLGYVVTDSDLQVWIGTRTDAYTNHDSMLSDADLTALGFTEVNSTTLSSARLADLNAGNLAGNVIVIAADTTDTSPEDMFKIQNLTVNAVQSGVYENKATVTAPGATDFDLSHYKNPVEVSTPGIDIEKTTNGPTNSNTTAPDYDNEDAANGAGVPLLTAGSAVTWTYQVTNTGNVAFARSDIAIVDDNGTVGNTSDDLSIANGKITYLSGDIGNDNILSAGEVWLYQATGTVQDLTTLGAATTFDFSGSSALDGTDGNIRTFTAGGISVHASAFSRVDGSNGAWSQAWLGSYGGGLGVTDSSEGSGGSNTHTVDNMGGRGNYVLFEFDQNVVLDSAYLGYVVTDSDLQVWIGTRTDAYTNHDSMLSDADLTALGFTEVNSTTLSSARLADLNAGNLAGNVIVIAADTTDTSPEDMFKIQNLTVNAVLSGVYENMATVTAQGVSDSDLSHYKNSTAPALASIGDRVWYDDNANGIQDDGEAGVAGVVVELRSNVAGGAGGDVLATTTTDANGYYQFGNLTPGDYHIDIQEWSLPSGYQFTMPDQGANDDLDSDVVDTSSIPLSWGVMANTTLSAGENDMSWDAGIYRKASIGDTVWCDSNKNGIQDNGEAGVSGVTVKLLDSNGSVVSTTSTNASGYYLFSDLTPGDYAIQVVAPTGYTFSAKDQGADDAKDSDVDTATGKTVFTTLVSGENDLSWDAGISQVVTKARIGDTVWEDLNYNGIQDAGESGIANVKVYLRDSAGTWLKTTYTDANGHYYFDVDAGTYKVQVVKPSGYYATKQDQGGDDGVDSDINSSGYTGLITVAAGQQDLTIDAGLYMKASVGDKVWDDMSHNNLQDGYEPGISGIKVTLKTASGSTVATTTTDGNGNYLFSNLNPGDYFLVFDKTNVMHYNYGSWYNMSYWKWAVKDAGYNDSIDSDVNGNAWSTTNVTRTDVFNLESGENDMTWDAGITPIAIDLNGDGIQTVSRAASTGAFDLLGSGKAIQSGWLSGEDGFLAVDSNGNGRIDDINELFGGNNKGDGYAKLAAFDSNGDGSVDANDAAFADLRVWQDANGNHQTDAGELMTLDEAGVASLSLDYLALPLMDGNGNLHLERGSATLADGTSVDMTDVYFGVSADDVSAAGIELPDLAQLMGDDAGLDGLLSGLGETAAVPESAPVAAADAYDAAVFDGMKQMAALYDEQAACCA